MATHHIVTMLFLAWGHSVSYIYIATQLLQKDLTLAITMVQHNLLGSCIPLGPMMLKEAFSQLAGGWIENILKLAQGSEGWPKPHTFHMDFFGGGMVIEPTKQIMGPECKILSWYSSALCPGIPEIYDQGRVTHTAGPPLPGLGGGLLVAAPIAVLQRILPETRAGPLYHRDAGTRNEVVRSFLEIALGQYGPNSVLYISFGSFFFPVATPQLVEALVNTLLHLEKPFPSVFALGGKLASLPKQLIETVKASGKGLGCDFWVEQRAILQHAAVGWFLTHGGFNSISESLSQGVPLIVWPTIAEQPINAALLSSEPNPVAFELLQIRTGPQLGPSLRGGPKITGTVEDTTSEFEGTFAAARGPKGAILTANAQRMARTLREARAGEVFDELIRLARF
ncbi:hypothetical protein DFH09DRAFT_1277941 [Mycena vulgaris]|nr:hypothetical protein DFH09DRAFT_1277941 [Mycena vulgaris]